MFGDERERYFLGNSETLIITHVWGTFCNLKCHFCLNEGISNLNMDLTKDYNFKITDAFSDLKNINRNILFVEHGGELLFCNYLHELFEYKISIIKNYRALFFTNGTNFKKYKTLMEKFSKYIEPFLSFHSDELNENKVHINDFKKCIEYNINAFGYCNIAMVYHTNLNFETFTMMIEKYLTEYKSKIKIKIFFDKDMLDRSIKFELLKSVKFMKYLDNNEYIYKKLLSDDSHKTFINKSLFCLNEKYRENIISKFMAAIEIVNDKIQYVDFLKKMSFI